MKTYKDFRPTTFDSHIPLDGIEDWLVLPCGRNRDSDVLSESNFHSALAELGGEGKNVQIHRFGHWANGWFEIILVRPDTDESDTAESIEASLADYPILDDLDYCEREMIAANEVWENCFTVAQRIEYIREHRYQFEFQSFADMLGCVRGKYFAGYASEIL